MWFFLTSPHTSFPLLKRDDETLRVPTIQSISHSITQEFFLSCIEECKKLLCDEAQWADAVFAVQNVCALLDPYYSILTQSQDDAAKYKAEIVVNAVFGQLSTIQLLPDILVQWKAKDGIDALFALIIGIDSLLRICGNMKERGTTVLKKKRARKTKDVTEEEEETTHVAEFNEFLFNLRFIYNIIYRNQVYEKCVQWCMMIYRFILILYNYAFHPPAINRCLYNYFNNLYAFWDEEDNNSIDEDFNLANEEQVHATLRPKLFNALLLEVLNRILHDPLATKKGKNAAQRDDIVALGELGKKIVGCGGCGNDVVWRVREDGENAPCRVC